MVRGQQILHENPGYRLIGIPITVSDRNSYTEVQETKNFFTLNYMY